VRTLCRCGCLLAIAAILSVGILWATGCGVDVLLNQTASLGGETAGLRGTVRVVFINNTPFRAIFTAGTYDQTDKSTQPDFVQFAADPQVGLLEGDDQSRALELRCARVFSVGGDELLALIRCNLPDADLDEDASIEGVAFSDAKLDDDDAGQATEGKAAPLVVKIGADFPCNALLIVRLEFNDLGPEPFLVDFSFIPSEEDR